VKTDESTLTLGWRLDDEGHPAYWMHAGARAGGQPADALVSVCARDMARHTGIIAQSGSGKSFFLGRLIEEILLNTRAKVIILDPNADFRNYHDLNPALWDRPGYDPKRGLGSLPTEPDMAQVDRVWRSIPKRIARGDLPAATADHEPMQIWWPLLTMGLFAGELGAAEGVELRHCHTFVQSVEQMLRGRLSAAEELGTGANLLLDKSQDALNGLMAARETAGTTRAQLRTQLAGMLGIDAGSKEAARALDRAAAAAQYVSREVAHFYFARARECEIAGILRRTPPTDWQSLQSFTLDLPSIANPELRLLCVYQTLARLWAVQREAWQEAMAGAPTDDRRVPYFIVVDEAHNLIPMEPSSPAAEVVRDMFRSIAAEGRKFGLFLVVVSQRPDKLDPMILSECENKVVMRLDSPEVLEKVRNALGVQGALGEQLGDCLKFRTGRGFLFGTWAREGPVKFMAAARRTVEGGRNLDPKWWTQRDAWGAKA